MDNENDNALEKRYNIKGKKGFIKGNPGKKPGTKNYWTYLEEALEKKAKEKSVSYYDKIAEWCFRYPSVAIAVLKKFIPDRTHTEIETQEPLKFEVEILNGNKKSQSE
ncbi:hypothetical protein FJY90_07090 [Candidatus Gottesmanbacteria bacterium]|nr:hypothetical protein [Candidatus Gottesmanbacteria bacterium]